MIYLDYSATTPVEEEVLETFVKVNKEFIGNANSLHKLGVRSKLLMDQATEQISKILKVKPSEIIYTSGSSESNNTALLGITKYSHRGKEIITTSLEHSSILEPLKFLEQFGYRIRFVSLNEDGTVNLSHLKELLSDETVLVTIGAVNSELGISQDLDAIGKIVKEYPKCFFHTDLTQAVGKREFSLNYVDMASFSAHKFYGLKGVGVLVKKESVDLYPLIHGGKSTTKYRSGTPALGLIVSLAKALRLSVSGLEEKRKVVSSLNAFLKEELSKIEEVHINSTSSCIPHILNFSVVGIKPETLLHALEDYDIYVSTKTACSSSNSKSEAVYEVTKSEDYASSSIRVSLSHKTTKEELITFCEVLRKIIKELL